MRGLRDGVPICIGYLSVSFAFGIFTISNGLTIAEAVLISMTNVTSAGQLAGVPIMVGGGTLIELIVPQFIINLRYGLMSVSLSQKFDGSIKLRHRFLLAFMNTDEVFAVAMSQRNDVNLSYMLGLILTPYLGWSFGTLLGSAAGDILPSIVTNALGIAIYGMFVAIVIPPSKKSRAVALCCVFAAALSCAFRFIPVLSHIPSGFVIIICACVSAVTAAIAAPVKTEV